MLQKYLLPILIAEATGICILQKLHGTIFLFDSLLFAFSNLDLNPKYILKATHTSRAMISNLVIPIFSYKQ